MWEPVLLLSITDFLFQQYIAICNKYTSVPLTDIHLQRTCSEIVQVQTQSCDHNYIMQESTQCFSEIE